MKNYKILIFFIAIFFLIVIRVILQKESDDIHVNESDYKNIEVKIIYEADLSKDYEIDDMGEDIDIEKAVMTAEDYLNRTEISNMAVEVLDYKSENIYIVRFFYDDIDIVGGATCVAINKKSGEVLETYGEE